VNRLAGAVRWVADREGLLDVADVRRHEAGVIAQVPADLGTDVAIADALGDALGGAKRLAEAARAANATVAAVLALPDAATIRRGLDVAIALVPSKSLITRAPGDWVRRADLEAELPVLRAQAGFATAPATPAALATQTDAIAAGIRRLRPPRDNASHMQERVGKLLASGLEGPR
jgi:hypothetical protein